jgi:hypothetical protein
MSLETMLEGTIDEGSFCQNIPKPTLLRQIARYPHYSVICDVVENFPMKVSHEQCLAVAKFLDQHRGILKIEYEELKKIMVIIQSNTQQNQDCKRCEQLFGIDVIEHKSPLLRTSKYFPWFTILKSVKNLPRELKNDELHDMAIFLENHKDILSIEYKTLCDHMRKNVFPSSPFELCKFTNRSSDVSRHKSSIMSAGVSCGVSCGDSPANNQTQHYLSPDFGASSISDSSSVFESASSSGSSSGFEQEVSPESESNILFGGHYPRGVLGIATVRDTVQSVVCDAVRGVVQGVRGIAQGFSHNFTYGVSQTVSQDAKCSSNFLSTICSIRSPEEPTSTRQTLSCISATELVKELSAELGAELAEELFVELGAELLVHLRKVNNLPIDLETDEYKSLALYVSLHPKISKINYSQLLDMVEPRSPKRRKVFAKHN